MHEKRTQNILLAIAAMLLLLNLGARLSPAVQATPPRTQYKAVQVYLGMGQSTNLIQQALDQQSAQGWEYVGEAGSYTLIFKK